MDPPPLIHFYDEPIEPVFSVAPAFEKSPHCPDAFVWRDLKYPIVEMLAEWHDYRRRGRMADNMQPAHAAAAMRRGSLGVGRFYFRVRCANGSVYDIYYDRAPKNAFDKKGHWFIFGERGIESRE